MPYLKVQQVIEKIWDGKAESLFKKDLCNSNHAPNRNDCSFRIRWWLFQIRQLNLFMAILLLIQHCLKFCGYILKIRLGEYWSKNSHPDDLGSLLNVGVSWPLCTGSAICSLPEVPSLSLCRNTQPKPLINTKATLIHEFLNFIWKIKRFQSHSLLSRWYYIHSVHKGNPSV